MSGSSPLNNRLRNWERRPASSSWLNGHRVIRSIRPVKVSATPRLALSCEEPVSRNRPGRWSRSTLALIASSRSGTRWTSSIASSPGRPATKPAGSASAAVRVAMSSSETYRAFGVPAMMSSTKVDLPACLGPTTPTTLVSVRASCAEARTNRGISLIVPLSFTGLMVPRSGRSAPSEWAIRDLSVGDPRCRRGRSAPCGQINAQFSGLASHVAGMTKTCPTVIVFGFERWLAWAILGHKSALPRTSLAIPESVSPGLTV